jgi:hypothetical protein
MAKSTYLNLELTDTNTPLFRDYRKALNGVGEGANQSNAQLVDGFAGKFAGGSSGQYLKKSGANNFVMEWETPDSAPTEDSQKLLESGAAFTAIANAKAAVDTGSRVVVATNGAVSQELAPDKFYSFTGTLTSLTLTLGSEVSGRENEYKGQFSTGGTAPTVTFPNGVSWVGGTPTIEANKTYQFSILDNIGVLVGV